MGYKIALWRDSPDDPPICDLMLTGEYPGYAQAVNVLVKEALKRDPKCEWIATGGDDTEPESNHTPELIAFNCGRYFGDRQRIFRMEATINDFGVPYARMPWSTFGVMQPTGDRFAEGSIDRIAGSPWIGREFCERMYGGKGPLFEGYLHMFEDQELQEVAEMRGVFWQRRDLVHLHRHFMRQNDSLDSPATSAIPPAHLVRWNSAEHWNESKQLYLSRKSQGFPGHEPIDTKPANDWESGNAPGIIRNINLDNGDPDLIEVAR